MVNQDRLVKEFVELVSIDSLTFKEREMADRLKSKFQELGLEVTEDEAGKNYNGNAGNLICTVKGNKQVPPILVMAHMDTVVPGTGKKPKVEGDIIKSDGTTVLGSDDGAGLACILETLRVLKEQNIEHGDITVAFTIAEEGGLFGAKSLDYSKLNAKYGFIMDHGGNIGNVAIASPSQNQIKITVKGKSAHAGVEPEKGISAIQIAALAISKMKLGRIDSETTANIGSIKGGLATNIICERIEMEAEARSHNDNKLAVQTEHMKQCFEDAANQMGGSFDFISELMYQGFHVNDNDPIIDIVRSATQEIGVNLTLEATGGASDTNIVNNNGIKAVDLSIGMSEVHSVNEFIKISDMVKAVEFLVAIIKAVK